MTIKVIKPGIKDWHTVYRGTCRNCTCVVHCDKTDGSYVPHSYRGEGDYVTLECPNCKFVINCYPVKTTPTIDMREDTKPEYFYDR